MMVEQMFDARRTGSEPSFKFTDKWFPYTSGEIGPYYVQSACVLENPEQYRAAITDLTVLAETLDAHFTVISGGESRDWIFSYPLALALQLPHMSVYKDSAVRGVQSGEALHVADLNNEGSSFRNYWVPTLQKRGGRIVSALFYVDRLEKGTSVLNSLGIPHESVVPLDAHAWRLLLGWGAITPDVYVELLTYMSYPQEWAHKKLCEYPEKLVDLLKNPKTHEKGMKILDKGYPEMREDICEMLSEDFGVEL